MGCRVLRQRGAASSWLLGLHLGLAPPLPLPHFPRAAVPQGLLDGQLPGISSFTEQTAGSAGSRCLGAEPACLSLICSSQRCPESCSLRVFPMKTQCLLPPAACVSPRPTLTSLLTQCPLGKSGGPCGNDTQKASLHKSWCPGLIPDQSHQLSGLEAPRPELSSDPTLPPRPTGQLLP